MIQPVQFGALMLAISVLHAADTFAQGTPVQGIGVTVTNDPTGVTSGVTLDTLFIDRTGSIEIFTTSELIGIDVLEATRPGEPIAPDATVSPSDFVLIGPAREPLGLSADPRTLRPEGQRESYLTDDDVTTFFLDWPVITVRFVAPIINAPGPDIVIIEGTSDTVIDGNPDAVPPFGSIDDRAFTVSDGLNTMTVAPDDYADLNKNYNLGFFLTGASADQNGPRNFPPTNLAELETIPFGSLSGSLARGRTKLLWGVAFDLADLGYVPGAVINDLELTFTSGDPDSPDYFVSFDPSNRVFDPSLIAALPPTATVNPCDFNASGTVDFFDVSDIQNAAQNADPRIDRVEMLGTIDGSDVNVLVDPIRNNLCE